MHEAGSSPTVADTDLGNARRLITRHGRDLRHCEPWRKWIVWDGRRWQLDQTSEVIRRATDVVDNLLNEAVALAGPERDQAVKHALRSQGAQRIFSMVRLAASEPSVAILPSELDRHPYLFNCTNGTLDLRTGELRPARREDLITQLCPLEYRPEAVCPCWESALLTIFAGDHDLTSWFQRLAGYCLTGCVNEQVLPICWGAGANGKSVIFETLRQVMGPDYAGVGADELIQSGDQKPHPTFKAALFGKRLVTLSELEENGRLNESLIKKLTGSEKISARRMREDLWEFEPTHKIVIATNHKPDIKGTDDGVWRRLRLLPFTRRFWNPDAGEQGPAELKADKHLLEKLLPEAQGILTWLVRGCLAWQQQGLNDPPIVTRATGQFRSEQDALAAFLEECCRMRQDLLCRATELYVRYQKWHKDNGEQGQPMSQRKFGGAMTARGFEKRHSGGTIYLGLDLRQEATVEDLWPDEVGTMERS
jgi:putative DNA primase/helicase